jgi:hypothetical protein
MPFHVTAKWYQFPASHPPPYAAQPRSTLVSTSGVSGSSPHWMKRRLLAPSIESSMPLLKLLPTWKKNCVMMSSSPFQSGLIQNSTVPSALMMLPLRE